MNIIDVYYEADKAISQSEQQEDNVTEIIEISDEEHHWKDISTKGFIREK